MGPGGTPRIIVAMPMREARHTNVAAIAGGAKGGTIPAHMRDGFTDTVKSGGLLAPLGARAAELDGRPPGGRSLAVLPASLGMALHYLTGVVVGASFGLTWPTTCLRATRLLRR